MDLRDMLEDHETAKHLRDATFQKIAVSDTANENRARTRALWVSVEIKEALWVQAMRGADWDWDRSVTCDRLIGLGNKRGGMNGQ